MLYKKIDLHCTVFCNVSEEVAKEYIDYRILRKSAMTQGGFNRAMNQSTQCTCTPDEAIILTMDKHWIGVTPEYVNAELVRRFEANIRSMAVTHIQKITSNKSHDPNNTRTRTIEQDLTDRSWIN
jgi:hypothetical protein